MSRRNSWIVIKRPVVVECQRAAFLINCLSPICITKLHSSRLKLYLFTIVYTCCHHVGQSRCKIILPTGRLHVSQPTKQPTAGDWKLSRTSAEMPGGSSWEAQRRQHATALCTIATDFYIQHLQLLLHLHILIDIQ